MGRGRAPCCEKVGLNRGSWTPEEDIRLITHIRKHGHGNWRALPKQAGLLRCGKSCRLRWINYLRPDIKRGNFSKEEENTIIKLHGLLGNKWAKIASCLPGRTDNEIKNVWNTHLKKRLNNNHQDPSLSTTPSSSSSEAAPTLSIESKCSAEHSEDAESLSAGRIEIPLEEPNLGLWDLLDDASLDTIANAPSNAELWSDVVDITTAEDSQWLAILEEELGLMDGSGGGGGGSGGVTEEEVGEAVRGYVHRIPSSPSPLHFCSLPVSKFAS
ncbi:hypothetical protein HPP92_002949 [Vanilla planifolia]|uniref:Uncharacterized protein n=1 Tax=Vanilla planifolia TaxID=51239 RepID=A0A835SFJ7_VANPL|nr:hypothetical protein HPP92_002949 [Vanilla planifolia]